MNGLAKIVVLGLLINAPMATVQAESSAAQQQKVAADPNERVCEDVIVTGSRLATKRFCGTRAEWEAKKKQDRDVIEDAQRHANDPCNSILTHSGTPAC